MRTIGKETLATGMRVIVSAHLFSMLAILTNACGIIVHAGFWARQQQPEHGSSLQNESVSAVIFSKRNLEMVS